jgi:hypothetical protein
LLRPGRGRGGIIERIEKLLPSTDICLTNLHVRLWVAPEKKCETDTPTLAARVCRKNEITGEIDGHQLAEMMSWVAGELLFRS